MKKNILFLALLACFVTSGVFAAVNNGDDLIEKCAEKIIDDRIYLKPGLTCVAQKDIFVKVDEAVIPLDAVYCDKDGIFVYAHQLGSLVECSTCRRYYDPEKQRPICPHKYRWE